MGREQLRFKTVASGALPGSLLMTLMEGENDRGRESLGTVFFPKFSISTSTSSRGMDGGSSRWRLTPFAYYIIQICRGKNARVNFKGAKKSKSGKHSSSLPLSLSRSVPIFHCHPLSRFPPPPSLPPPPRFHPFANRPASCNPFSIPLSFLIRPVERDIYTESIGTIIILNYYPANQIILN